MQTDGWIKGLASVAVFAAIAGAFVRFRDMARSKTSSPSSPDDKSKPDAEKDQKSAPVTATAPKPGAESNIKKVDAALRAIWKDITGRDGPSDTERLLVLSIAFLETGLGSWWTDKSSEGKGDMRGSENLGAIQCRQVDLTGTPPAQYRCVKWEDHHADGSAYVTGFRYYQAANGKSAAENAAADFLKQLSKPIRPKTSEVMANGGGPDEMATTMRVEHYFEAPADKYASAIRSRAVTVASVLGIALPGAFKAKTNVSGVSRTEGFSTLRLGKQDPFADIRTIHHNPRKEA